MADLELCAACGTGPMPKTMLGRKSPQLRKYICYRDDSRHPVDICLHDNCLIEYMEANPFYTLSRSL